MFLLKKKSTLLKNPNHLLGSISNKTSLNPKRSMQRIFNRTRINHKRILLSVYDAFDKIKKHLKS